MKISRFKFFLVIWGGLLIGALFCCIPVGGLLFGYFPTAGADVILSAFGLDWVAEWCCPTFHLGFGGPSSSSVEFMKLFAIGIIRCWLIFGTITAAIAAAAIPQNSQQEFFEYLFPKQVVSQNA